MQVKENTIIENTIWEYIGLFWSLWMQYILKYFVSYKIKIGNNYILIWHIFLCISIVILN